MKFRAATIILCLLMTASAVMAQTELREKTDTNMKKADYSADHKSIDSIMKATYLVISGAKGEKRDWDRFEALFYPGARLIPTSTNQEGINVARPSTAAEYKAGAQNYFDSSGFYEMEIARRVDLYGNIAQVFSTYESRHSLEEEKPFLRGINSFQLFNDGKRWWVMTIYWQQESDASPIPKIYLETPK